MAAPAQHLADLLAGAEERPLFEMSHRTDLLVAPMEAYAMTRTTAIRPGSQP